MGAAPIELRYECKRLGEYPNYAVHSSGRLFRIEPAKRGKGAGVWWMEIFGNVLPNGYTYVGLSRDRKSRMKSLHRLIASAFCDKPHGRDQVNHIDGVPTNNAASNLEWVTPLENIRHAIDTGLRAPRKLTESDVIEIYLSRGTVTQSELAETYGVHRSTVSRIQLGQKYARYTNHLPRPAKKGNR